MTRTDALLPAASGAVARPLDLAAVLGPAAWARLPAAVRRRFAAGHADATYRGALDLECSRIGRVFAWCSALLGGPLPALVARDVPTDVLVYADGRGGMVWERRLHVPGRGHDRVVRSTKEPGDGAVALVERTDGGLAMDLALSEEDGALVFESRRYFIALGRLRLPVPAWLAPGTCRVEHRDLGAGRFRFTLSMVHPWWGRTFHQTGIFTDPEEEKAHPRSACGASPSRGRHQRPGQAGSAVAIEFARKEN